MEASCQRWECPHLGTHTSLCGIITDFACLLFLSDTQLSACLSCYQEEAPFHHWGDSGLLTCPPSLFFFWILKYILSYCASCHLSLKHQGFIVISNSFVILLSIWSLVFASYFMVLNMWERRSWGRRDSSGGFAHFVVLFVFPCLFYFWHHEVR